MVCASSGRTPWPWDPCRSRSHAARSSSCSALRGAVRPRCCACWAGSRPRTPVGSKWRGGGGRRGRPPGEAAGWGFRTPRPSPPPPGGGREMVAVGRGGGGRGARRGGGVVGVGGPGGLGGGGVEDFGGGRQRGGGRAGAGAPGRGVLFREEPLSNLDPSLRERTR